MSKSTTGIGTVSLASLEASLKRAARHKMLLMEALDRVLLVADSVDSYRRITGKPHPSGFTHMAITECDDNNGARPGGSYAHLDFEPLRKLLDHIRES